MRMFQCKNLEKYTAWADELSVDTAIVPIVDITISAPSADDNVSILLCVVDTHGLTRTSVSKSQPNDIATSVATGTVQVESILEETVPASTSTTEFRSEIKDLPTKRKRIIRAVDLNSCFCGSILSSSTPGVVQCKRIGCETQWVSSGSFMRLMNAFLTFISS